MYRCVTMYLWKNRQTCNFVAAHLPIVPDPSHHVVWRRDAQGGETSRRCARSYREQIELIGCGLAPEQQSLEVNAIAVRRPALHSGPDGLRNLSWNH